jgi:F-type H+-transporting ATPase subunit b|tara:strand:- start:6462 stop:6965 length:504 start_codon:yes stop_codon:yes gene_type:complete
MPQLDITAFSPQIIWLVITFLVLYVLMAKIALPRIGSILEERQARIDDNLDAAQSLRNESSAEAEAYEKSMAEAREQARSAIYDATQEMSADSARRHEELGTRLSGDLKAAEERISQAKEAAVAGIHEAAASVAAQATERLIGIEPADEAVASAISTALDTSVKEAG